MKRKGLIYPLLALTFLIIATLACGESSTGEKIGESEAKSEESAPKLETFEVGDIIKVQEHIIVLNSAKFSGGKLTANFTIENKGDDDVIVSTMLDFEARSDDGTTLDEAIFDCDSGLGGTVLPGDKMRGNICWKNAKPPCKIYYTAELFGSGAVVWQVK